jgi:radical SAM superfamily enzyme YgiQ (UPF0313 family)
MYVGSPHLGLPLLQGVARRAGVDLTVRDLNVEVSEFFDLKPRLADLHAATAAGDIESLNKPYFDLEDRFNDIARPFGGTWNVQLGFQYAELKADSSAEVLAAAEMDSPFRSFFIERVIPDVRRLQPAFIGISIAAPGQLIPAFQLCRALKNAGYDGLIIMGGNIISRIREDLFHPDLYKLVDVFVGYQGEFPFLGLINALKQGKCDFAEIPNLVYFDGRRVVGTPVLDRIDLERLPAPDFAGFPLGRYWGENYVTLVGARGCYYGRCHFCAIPLGWNNKGFAGARSADLVFADMVDVHEQHGVTRFKFIDEAMLPKMMLAIAKKIEERRLPFEWEAYTRLEKIWLDPDFVAAVARGGFRKAYFGLEVIPGQNRNRLNKRDCPDPETILDRCAKYGVKVHFFCLFGFPGTGRPEAEATIEFVLNHADKVDTLDIFRFGYMRGTKVPGAKPIIRSDKDWALEYEWAPDETGVLSVQESEELKIELEELMWNEHPKMLHPTYRMLSPWRGPA